MRVYAGPNGRAAEGQFVQMTSDVFQPPRAMSDLAGIAAELLSQSHRRGILQMGPPDFQYLPKGLRLSQERFVKFSQSGPQLKFDSFQRGQVNCRRDDIV